MSTQVDYLGSDEALLAGDTMVSPCGFYTLRMGGSQFCVGTAWTDIWCSTGHPQPGGPFIMVMQTDGNLCIYPGVPGAYSGAAVWASNSWGAEGRFYAVVTDEGDLEVHVGSGPSQDGGVHWSASGAKYMKRNPVVAISDVASVQYVIDQAAVATDQLIVSFGQKTEVDVPNNGDTEQTIAVTLQADTVTTSLWTDSVQLPVDIPQTLEVSLPLVTNGTVYLSPPGTTPYVRNTPFSFSTPENYPCSVPVPPHTVLAAWLTCNSSTITVPFLVRCQLALSYAQTSALATGWGTYRGTYSGSNEWDFQCQSGPRSALLAARVAMAADAAPSKH